MFLLVPMMSLLQLLMLFLPPVVDVLLVPMMSLLQLLMLFMPPVVDVSSGTNDVTTPATDVVHATSC